MSPTAVDYAVRAYEDRDRSQVLDLLEASLAGGPTGRRTAAYFTWKHERNPFGRSVALVADLDGSIIGFRTMMRWRFRTCGHTVAAVRPVDTATHPEHQGKGVFKQLTLATLEGLEGGTDLVFNTPNAASRPGYLTMGWQPVGTVPIQLRVARPLRFLRGVRSATRGAPAGRPVPSRLPPARDVLADYGAVGALLAATAPDRQRLTTDRSVAYLRWRYAEAPGLDYRAIPLTRSGELAGLALGRLRHRGRLIELTLTELLVRDGDAATARDLLRAAARSGADHVATHLSPGGLLAGAGLRAGYVTVPGQGIALVSRPLTPICPDPLALSSWAFSLGDLELF